MGRGLAQLLALLALFSIELNARAHTYVITDTNDTTAVTSLRGAIIAANQHGGDNTIILGEEPRKHQPPRTWTFYLTIQGANEYAALTGDLDVTNGNLTIVGAAPGVTIDAASLGDRVFHVYPGVRLDLENVTVQGGSKPYPQNSGGGGGGGIIIIGIGGGAGSIGGGGGNIGGSIGSNLGANSGIPPLNPILPITLPPPPSGSTGANNIQPPALAANARPSAANPSMLTNGGGGILNNGAMTMRNSLVMSNLAMTGYGGGGILNTGSLLMENCTVANNSTAKDISGAGIYNVGTITLNNCLVISNAVGGGNAPAVDPNETLGGTAGGIYNSGSLTMQTCVVGDNMAGTGSFGGDGGTGGGIRNEGVCLLIDCQILNNLSGNGSGSDSFFGSGGNSGNGGGIYNDSIGSLKLFRCNISRNESGQAGDASDPVGFFSLGFKGGPGGEGGSGGGIYNAGELSLDFCAIVTNVCSSGGSGGTFGVGGNAGNGGNGGAIFNAGEITLNTCTISGNVCGSGGAGGDSAFYGGGNGGNGGSGGGIYNTGSISVVSVTIVSNSAGIGGDGGYGDANNFFGGTNLPPSGGQGGSGGGIFNAGISAPILANTIVGLNLANIGGAPGTNILNLEIQGPPHTPEPGNEGTNGIGPDVNGGFTSRGFNLIGAVDGSSGFVNGVGADQVGTTVAPIDPMIGPLAMNGGPTPTHALLPNSPAVDKGNSFGIREDQRGFRRPYNFHGIPNAAGGDGSDIGAFELDRGDERRDKER